MKYRTSEPKTEPEVCEYIDNFYERNIKQRRWRNQSPTLF